MQAKEWYKFVIMKPKLIAKERKCLIDRALAAMEEKKVYYETASKKYGISTIKIYRHTSRPVSSLGCKRTLTDEEKNVDVMLCYAHCGTPMMME